MFKVHGSQLKNDQEWASNYERECLKSGHSLEHVSRRLTGTTLNPER